MKLYLSTALMATAMAAHCGDFCADYQATCDGVMGASMYANETDCINECAVWARDFDEATVTAGNSFECREYHLGVAGSAPENAAVHCPHAGVQPTGGTCVEAAADVACEDYCTNALTVCGGLVLFTEGVEALNRTAGDLESLAWNSCIGFCKTLPVGTTSTSYPLAAPAEGTNTLSCRRYHVQVARTSDENAAIHCPHATYGDGQCGTSCEGFCSLAQGACTGDNAIYDDEQACLDACAGFATDGESTAIDGDSLQCRFYHLTVAASSAENAAVHCSHGGVDSPPCSSAALFAPSALLVAALAYAAM